MVLHAGVLNGRDLARTHAAIIAEAVDIDPVIVGIGVDLEADRLTVIDADIGRESLDIGAAGAVDAPLALRIALQQIFRHDLVGGRRCGCQTLRRQRPLRDRGCGDRAGKDPSTLGAG